MKTLLLVDIQNDFIPPGPLAVPHGQEVIAVANNLIHKYPLVVATQDWHPHNHLSFASQHPGHNIGDLIEVDGLPQILWPDHCVQNTPGAELCSGLDKSRIDHIICKGTDRTIDSYGAFFDNQHRKETGLDAFLKSRNVDEIHIAGLATDYCVKFTALDAVALGFKTVLITEAVRGVELKPGDCDKAIKEMINAGVRILRKLPLDP